jgi:hypothetical protein
MSNLRFTPAITFVIHTAISILVGAIVAGLTALMQIIFTSSDPRVILATSTSAFLAWFVHGFVSLAKSPQLVQAESDAFSELKGVVESHTQAISALQQFSAPVAPAPQFTTQVPQQQFVQPAPQPQPPFQWQAGTTFPTMPTVPAQ